jgi:hypothetical protein
MTIPAKDVKQLCTAAELQLVNLSFGQTLKGVTPARLRQLIAQARRLRDKYRGESQRQRRESRGKAAPRGRTPSRGNNRTVQKVQVFQETLDRFQAKLDKLCKPEPEKKAKAAAQPAPRKKAKSAAKAAATPATSGTGKQARRLLRREKHDADTQSARQSNLQARTPRARLKGHVSATTRKAQARRDSKR